MSDNGLAAKSLIRTVLLIVTTLMMNANAQNPSAPSGPGNVQLVAVQMTLNLANYWTPEAFEASIRARMEQVAASTDPDLPTLVVFPEDIGLMLVVQGMESELSGLDSIDEAIGTAVRSNMLSLAWTRLIRWQSWVPALFLNRHEAIAETYFTVFSSMAREYGVHLVAGSVILPPYPISDGVVQWERGPSEHRVYNSSYLFGPDGLVLGRQDKVDLIELEREAALNLSAGTISDLRVFDTPVGKVGIAICKDAFSDEIVAHLTGLGAQILVQPSANPGPWSDWQQDDWLNSAHSRVAQQRQFAYAVNPMLNGPLWDLEFFGQSSIVSAASEATELGYASTGPANGFINVAAHEASQEVLVAVVPHPDHLGLP